MLGTPHCAAVAVGSTNPKLDVFVLADLMEEKGSIIFSVNYCVASMCVCTNVRECIGFVCCNRLEVGTCSEVYPF